MFQRVLFLLILTIGLVALPNAAKAFQSCTHCEECTESLHYQRCQHLVGCEGDWCNYQGPSTCDCGIVE